MHAVCLGYVKDGFSRLSAHHPQGEVLKWCRTLSQTSSQNDMHAVLLRLVQSSDKWLKAHYPHAEVLTSNRPCVIMT